MGTAVSGSPSAALFATILLLLAATGPRLATAAHNPAWLAELIEQQRYEEAWELANAHLAAHAGDVQFDFHYGLAAIETGHLGEAIFALERILIQAPGLDRARIELARALFLQGDDLRARREFEIVLAHDPPQAVAVRIQRYLAAMDRRADRYRTTVTGWLEAEVGHDSNANRAPDTGTIDITFGTLTLGEEQQETDAAFVRGAGGAEVSRPLRPGLNLVGSVGAEVLRFDGASEFDTSLLHGQVGLRRTEGAHQLSGFLQAYSFYVDDDDYQDALGIAGSYTYEIDDDTSVQVFGRVTDLQYTDELEVRDSTLALVGIGAGRSWLGRLNPSASISVMLGEEDPDDDSVQARALASRDIWGLQGWFGITPMPDWSLQARALYRNSDYETNTFPFAEARDEDYYSIDVSLDWYPTVNWRVGPHLDYSENDANIDLYDYERTVIGVRARYSFY